MKKETNNKTTKKKETEEIEFLTLDEEPTDIKSSIQDKTEEKDTKKTITKADGKDKKKNRKARQKANSNRKEKKKKLLNKKNVFLVLAILVIVVGVFIFIYMGMVQKFLVQNEIQDLEQLVQAEQMNYDQIERKLKQTVSLGPYKKVEQAFKDYVSEVVNTAKAIQSLTSSKNLSNVLSADNLKNDGPKFQETEQYLTTTKEELDTKLNYLIELMHKEKIMSYAEKKQLSKKYMDFYEEVAIDHNENLDSMQQSLQQSLDYYMQVFDTFDQAISFLKSHDTWKIENNKLVFNSSQDFEEYNKIVESLHQE